MLSIDDVVVQRAAVCKSTRDAIAGTHCKCKRSGQPVGIFLQFLCRLACLLIQLLAIFDVLSVVDTKKLNFLPRIAAE